MGYGAKMTSNRHRCDVIIGEGRGGGGGGEGGGGGAGPPII